MRTEEQIEFQYRNYLKICGKERANYDAAFDPFPYAKAIGAVHALGLTLEKSFKEIKRDIERAERKKK